MRQVRSVFIVALGIAIASLAGGPLVAQTTSGTEVKQFEIVSVDGNRVVVRGENGVAQEIVVPADFRLTVDGQPVSVSQLKPGMRGTARITTTTTVTPVTITEIKQGRVLKVSGNTIIVRLEDGSNKMFTESEASKRGVKINRPDGRPMSFSEIREGVRTVGHDRHAEASAGHDPARGRRGDEVPAIVARGRAGGTGGSRGTGSRSSARAGGSGSIGQDVAEDRESVASFPSCRKFRTCDRGHPDGAKTAAVVGATYGARISRARCAQASFNDDVPRLLRQGGSGTGSCRPQPSPHAPGHGAAGPASRLRSLEFADAVRRLTPPEK